MAEEIQEAVQIIRVAYDGIEIAMKVGSGGIAAMQKAIDFLKGMLDYEKSLGKTSMRKLLLKGGDLQVLQFNTEDMKKVEKMAKKYGILYSVLPDCNRKDGLSEVIFHTEAVPRVNMMHKRMFPSIFFSLSAYNNIITFVVSDFIRICSVHIRNFCNRDISGAIIFMNQFFHLPNLKTVYHNIHHRFGRVRIISFCFGNGHTTFKGF